MTERDIIEGCKRNDRRCQEALYKMFSGSMKVTCYRYMNSTSDVKDVLQDGFIKVFHNIDKFNYEGSFEGWIRKTIINTALTKVTKFNHNEESEFIDEEHDSYDYNNPVANMHVKELRRLITSLPFGYRRVFNMSVLDGYSHIEISQTLNITVPTVRSQLMKARRMLQEKIKQLEKIMEHDK